MSPGASALIFWRFATLLKASLVTTSAPTKDELLDLDVKHAERDMVLPKCASSQESWAVKKPKLTIHAISSDDDVPVFTLLLRSSTPAPLEGCSR